MSSDGSCRIYKGQTLSAILQRYQNMPSTPSTSNAALVPPRRTEGRHFFIASTTNRPDATRHTSRFTGHVTWKAQSDMAGSNSGSSKPGMNSYASTSAQQLSAELS